MRISIASVVLGLGSLLVVAGCQRAGDVAEESARTVQARADQAQARAPQARPGATSPIEAPTPIASSPADRVAPPASEGAEHHSCGGGCGASCNGQCGPSCGGGMTASASPTPVPADADWQVFQVEGMHCGGCARRIQTALAQIDGVVGSEVDLGTHTVRVAVKKGVDARRIAAPAINELGYRVVR